MVRNSEDTTTPSSGSKASSFQKEKSQKAQETTSPFTKSKSESLQACNGSAFDYPIPLDQDDEVLCQNTSISQLRKSLSAANNLNDGMDLRKTPSDGDLDSQKISPFVTPSDFSSQSSKSSDLCSLVATDSDNFKSSSEAETFLT